MAHAEALTIATPTHGRCLVRHGGDVVPRRLLVGFHGYAENAAIQMARLESIAPAPWTCVSVQGLHRFYRGRSSDVVASWMTREDREIAIEDNLAYVGAVLGRVLGNASATIVYAGFSQGVAMAFRAAGLVGSRPAGVIAVGGDVPPELTEQQLERIPAALIARGADDDVYPGSTFDADVRRLTSARVAVTPLVFEGGHDWTAALSEVGRGFLERLP